MGGRLVLGELVGHHEGLLCPEGLIGGPSEGRIEGLVLGLSEGHLTFSTSDLPFEGRIEDRVEGQLSVGPSEDPCGGPFLGPFDHRGVGPDEGPYEGLYGGPSPDPSDHENLYEGSACLYTEGHEGLLADLWGRPEGHEGPEASPYDLGASGDLKAFGGHPLVDSLFSLEDRASPCEDRHALEVPHLAFDPCLDARLIVRRPCLNSLMPDFLCV